MLLRLMGRTEAVEAYLRTIGTNDVEIKANEELMHSEWNVQFRNWTTPKAAVWMILSQFYAGKAISSQSRAFFTI